MKLVTFTHFKPRKEKKETLKVHGVAIKPSIRKKHKFY